MVFQPHFPHILMLDNTCQKIELWGPFLWMEFQCLNATEPLCSIFFFSLYNEFTVCKMFKWWMKRRGKNIVIAVVTIEILILGQHFSVCTATAQEKSSCERIFEVGEIFVLRLISQQYTILTSNQLTSISPKSSENRRLASLAVCLQGLLWTVLIKFCQELFWDS